ncbi:MULTISPECIES: hypothetical protein [unclassified Francisella]|uniref:hypothetical protein n=1 Tax=unclassified Francisella TaxID=2610885 RepID=UPI002E346662|nr:MULTISPECIES: hypothetical protein [unclassified Francisella]MED7819273.1 hypothetical protein [Francisella sp. 19S2-4]MED7830097.1 hypothetical protein [Francisella sp. 19S2-10]
MFKKTVFLLFIISILSSCTSSENEFYNKDLWDKFHKKNSKTTYNQSLSKLETAQENHKSYFNYSPYGADFK